MKIGPGVFVPVVGPSGAGKDSLISFAARRLRAEPGFRFARRTVTRPENEAAEAHDTMDEAAFLDAESRGAFALSWRSHGLCYGLPADIDDAIRARGVVVANLSRASVVEAKRRYQNVMTLLIAVSQDVLAGRLAARGRESRSEIAARIARNAQYADFGTDCHVIDNSGDLDDSGELMVGLLREAAARGRAPAAPGAERA